MNSVQKSRVIILLNEKNAYKLRESIVGSGQELFIVRPAALSAVCLCWLGKILNLGEVVLCVQSRPASTVDSVLHLIAVQNILGWLPVLYTTDHLHQISIFSQRFLFRSLFSLDLVAGSTVARSRQDLKASPA